MARDSVAANKTRPGRGRRFAKGLAIVFLFAVVAALAIVAGFYVAVASSLPSVAIEDRLTASETTKIFDGSATPVLLAELHGLENRETLEGDQIPQIMRDAVVAIEDERFYSHPGVDFLAILRATWANLRHGEIVQGGSTITQQLVKNAFVTDEQTLDRKLREAALAYQLEKKWSKEKILNEYLNVIYFGQGAYGIEAAAQTYFGVTASHLSVSQAAVLAGVVNAPSAHSPTRDPETALRRRDLVLNKMYQQEYISNAELRKALSEPLDVVPRDTIKEASVPYWIEMVREQLVARYGSSTVLEGGLRVYISVNMKLQQWAEEAIADVLDQPGDPSAALVAIDPHTGRLVAMVGGSDFDELQFNLATQGRRQPGSAFKPFLLVTALEQGIGPDVMYDSGPLTVQLPGGPWEVSSTDKGTLTLAEAMSVSSNGVYARLVMDLGAQAVAEKARDMGIESPLGDPPTPAIALGGLATGVSPLEMAMAYTTLATGGERVVAAPAGGSDEPSGPLVILRVTDSDGNLLEESHALRTRVIEEGVAAVTTSCLQSVIDSGTGTAADIDRPAAGKTGTTQNYRDAWFVGYTPDLVAAVWVGYPNEQKPMTNVHGIRVTGGSLPAEIWSSFMRQALNGAPATDFAEPPRDEWVRVAVCSESGLEANEFCPHAREILVAVDRRPTEICQIHKAPIVVADVMGLGAHEARHLLEAAGLVVVTEAGTLSWDAPETVLSQDPLPGTEIAQGDTVTLVVSVPDMGVDMPQLVGLDISAAHEIIVDLGLKFVDTTIADASQAGVVLSQSIVAGERVASGTTVLLDVGSGPEPTPE